MNGQDEVGSDDSSRQMKNNPLSLSKNGYQYLKANLVGKAIEEFEELLRREPENHYGLVGLGDCFRKLRKFQQAVSVYKTCLKYYPDNNYALFGLADSYKALHQYHEAIAVWELYYRHDNTNVTVLTRIAGVYRKVENFAQALALYNRVLEIEPDNPYALIGLGHLYYDFKRYQESLVYWKKMIDLQGNTVDIRVITSAGNCHRRLKSFQEGIAYFEQARKRQPDNFYALFGLADCYRGLQQHSQALIYWNEILRNNPTNKFILNRAAAALFSLGKDEEAEQLYYRALNQEFDVYSVLGLAAINRARGKIDAAITAIEQLRSNNPQNYRIYLELAACYEQKGLRKEAIKVLTDYQRRGYNRKMVNDYLLVLKSQSEGLPLAATP